MAKNKYLDKNLVTRLIIYILIIIFFGLIGRLFIHKTIETLSEPKEYKLPIYCVDRNDNKVSISFDAAWGNDDTQNLLDILEKYNVKTTFFLVGGWVERYPDDVKRIAEAGHDIGNHSTTHPHMTKLSKQQAVDELMITHQQVKELTGKDMNLFRPPFGDYDERLLDIANECGYYTIQWDVDSLDWKEYGVDQQLKTVLEDKDLGSGSIVLLHNNAKHTAEALEPTIKGLMDKGFEIVPLSELILKGDYYIDHTGRQISKKDKSVDEKDEEKDEKIFKEVDEYKPPKK